jgi:hypothetical protein
MTWYVVTTIDKTTKSGQDLIWTPLVRERMTMMTSCNRGFEPLQYFRTAPFSSSSGSSMTEPSHGMECSVCANEIEKEGGRRRATKG